MKIFIAKNDIVNHLAGFIVILFALSDILHSLGILTIATFLSIVVFILCFPIKDEYFKAAIFLIWILLISSLINPLFTQNGIGGSAVLLGNLILAFIYFQTEKRKLTKWILAAYFITLLFISYKLFVLKVPANKMYEGLSRNHAGFALTFWSVFALFHLKITYKKILIIIPILSLIISIFLIGRTSIAVNFVLLLVAIYFKFKNKGILPFLIASIIFLFLIVYILQQYGTFLITDTNLGEGLDTPRWKLWHEYIGEINLGTFFVGVDVTKNPFIHLYKDNPHNSFLKFHSRVGIGSIYFLVLYIISFFKYLRNKEYYILGLLMVLTTRAFFDSDILIGKFDFIFFILTFYWTQFNKRNNEPSNLHNYSSI